MYLRLFFAFLWTVTLTGQTPPAASTAPSTPSETKPASLSGKTVAVGGQPIKKVVLTLRSVEPLTNGQTMPSAYTANSDAEGKYVFEVVDPGRYVLSADRPGYQRSNYGARRPSTGGTVLSLTSGQTMSAVDFVLSPQIVISGKVLDSDGDPLSRVQVQAMRSMFSNGKRQLIPTGSANSDDNGEYKLQNLGPGKYYICAYPPRDPFFGSGVRSAAAPPPAGQPPKQEEAQVSTYYPGVTDAGAATLIELVPGRDRPGTDITLRKSPVFHVRGKVTGQIPGERTQMRVMVLANSSIFMGFNNASAPLDKNGAFDIFPVASGSYQVSLISAQGMLKVFASLPLDVGNRNVDDLTLTAEAPFDLTGQVKTESADRPVSNDPSKPSTTAVAHSAHISLQPIDGVSVNTPNAPTKEDDTFSLTGVSPGRYRVGVYSLPAGTYLKSIRFGDQDVLKNGLTLQPGGGSTPIEITISAKAGTLTGSVEGADGKPASATVTLIPDPPAPGRLDLYRQSNTDQNGRFSIQSISPGKYRAYAWTDLEPGNQFDPDFLKNYESKGVKIDVDESGAPQLKLTPVQQ